VVAVLREGRQAKQCLIRETESLFYRVRDKANRCPAGARVRAAVAVALLVGGSGLVLLTGCRVTVRGEERPLVRYQPIEGELEAVIEHRIDEQKSGVSERKSESTVFEERLRLRTAGDVYHPDFFSYSAAIGGGLSQQYLDADDLTGWSSGTLTDYRFTGEILRARPYSGTIHANKSEDLIARQFLGPLRAERQSEAATVFLRSESWSGSPTQNTALGVPSMMFQYSTSETTQSGFRPAQTDFFQREDERFRYTVSHDFSRASRMHFSYDRTDARQQSVGAAVETLTNTYNLSHGYVFGPNDVHRLDSLVNYVDQEGAFEYESLRWQERLRLQHTPSLLSKYDLHYTRLDRETLSSEQLRGQAGIEHRLFESLVTTLDGFGSRTDLGPQGAVSQYGGILGLSYRKTNPWGMLFSNYSAGFTRTDQTGAAGRGVVVAERHIATDVVPVELERTHIDVATIRVRDAAGNLFQRNDDYTVFQRNGRTFLEIIMFGMFPPSFTPGQEFFVDYEFLIEPERREDTLRQSFTIRQRFDNGLSLFYSYRTQDEWVRATDVGVLPDEYRVHTLAADYTRGGLFLLAEHSIEDSTLIPLTSTRLEGRYRWMIGPATSAGVGVSHRWLDFREPDERDVKLLEGRAEVFTRLTDNYSVSGSVDYRHEEDSRFGLTEGFQFRTEMEYQYRQFSAMMGAELSFLERRDDQIDSVFLYLRLLRRF
jgi:hypothetical protein